MEFDEFNELETKDYIHFYGNEKDFKDYKDTLTIIESTLKEIEKLEKEFENTEIDL